MIAILLSNFTKIAFFFCWNGSFQVWNRRNASKIQFHYQKEFSRTFLWGGNDLQEPVALLRRFGF